MTEKLFRKIMGDDSSAKWEGDNFIQGIKILEKYIDSSKEEIVEGSTHDLIWCTGVEEILKKGITEEDTIALRDLNWMIDETSDCLSCYV